MLDRSRSHSGLHSELQPEARCLTVTGLCGSPLLSPGRWSSDQTHQRLLKGPQNVFTDRHTGKDAADDSIHIFNPHL